MRVGLLPDVWPRVVRLLPGVMLVVGVYGVIQFAILPPWDRAWLVASGSNSFGEPYPFKVRVFGMSDSPGPYAALLGSAIVVGSQRVAARAGRERALWAMWSVLLLVPLVLTGVRLAIVGVVLVIAVQSLLAARGAGRLAPAGIVVVLGALLVAVVNRFGSTSSILTAGRLTAFNAGSDRSLQSRTQLIDLIPSGLSAPFGKPQTGGGLDNLLIDLLVRYGPVALGFLVVALGIIGAAAWRAVRFGRAGTSGAVALFLLVFSLGGNLFVSSTGVLAAVVFGSVVRPGRTPNEDVADQTDREDDHAQA